MQVDQQIALIGEACGCESLLLPDYLNDLNACAELEKCEAITSIKGVKCYDHWLRVVTHRNHDCLKYQDGNQFGYPAGFPVSFSTELLWSASAAQRCEAFLRTLNLWIDDEP